MSLNVVEKLPPLSELGFGKFYGPLMVKSQYSNGQWGPWAIDSVHNLSLHPGAKALHYAQEIFEGLKAYKTDKGSFLFRPQANIQRMTRSAEYLAMPPFPEEEFLKSLIAITQKSLGLIPDQPGALYLRPTMIGVSSALGVAPASEYLFYTLASPVGGYFGDVKSDKPACISVLITEKHVRAAPGGLGAAKTGANYAASLKAVHDSKKAGFNNVLFLDAIHRKNFEELSGMNVFVVDNGVLKTPPLGDTILAGVTRDSILKIAKSLSIPCAETQISIDSVIDGISKGNIREIFACGTASAITAINEIGWKGEKIRVSDGQAGPVSSKLYKTLMDVHAGKTPSPEANWLIPV